MLSSISSKPPTNKLQRENEKKKRNPATIDLSHHTGLDENKAPTTDPYRRRNPSGFDGPPSSTPPIPNKTRQDRRDIGETEGTFIYLFTYIILFLPTAKNFYEYYSFNGRDLFMELRTIQIN